MKKELTTYRINWGIQYILYHLAAIVYFVFIGLSNDFDYSILYGILFSIGLLDYWFLKLLIRYNRGRRYLEMRICAFAILKKSFNSFLIFSFSICIIFIVLFVKHDDSLIFNICLGFSLTLILELCFYSAKDSSKIQRVTMYNE